MPSVDPILARVSRRRRALGLTQSALARRAGISLATLQNVEAGRANPALGTLRRILGPLGLRLTMAPDETDWDVLAGLGVPLAVERASMPRPTEELPVRVRRAARSLASGEAGGDERKREALQAFLLALRGHFPSTWRRWFADAPAVRALAPREPSGRVIELSRISRERLAELL
jgi:transcriptional regulator with XRE-family HTH domain